MVKHIKYINSIVSPLLTFSHNNAIFFPFYLNQSLARPSTCSERDKNKGVPRDETITWLGLMSRTRENWGNETPGDVIIPRGSNCGKQISNVSVISAIWVFNTTELLIPKDQHPLAGPDPASWTSVIISNVFNQAVCADPYFSIMLNLSCFNINSTN